MVNTASMRAVVEHGDGVAGIEIGSVDVPVAVAGQAVVEVLATGICGTDVHIAHDEYAHERPVVMGHEVFGVAELADIRVDGTRVHIGGGATWGAVAPALAEEGLAISSGDTSSVGVGGLTLGGGIGWMVRAWGLASDQLVGAQVVTASGEIVEASATENVDLFWGLRGGGGSFGIVTRFDFEAHRIAGIVHGEYAVDGDAAAALRAARDVMRTAPRELTVTYVDVPAMDPSAPAGARLAAVWAGDDVEALQSALAPVATLEGIEASVTTPAYRDILLEMPEPEAGAEAPAPPGFLGGNSMPSWTMS